MTEYVYAAQNDPVLSLRGDQSCCCYVYDYGLSTSNCNFGGVGGGKRVERRRENA